MNIPLTPLRFKRRAADLYGRKLGIVCGNSRFSYREFAERCDRLHLALNRIQIGQGSTAAFLAFNCHRLLEAYFGVVDAGAVLLPLNFRLSAEELIAILNESEAQALFFDCSFLPVVEQMRPRLNAVRYFIALDGSPENDWIHPSNYEEMLAETGLEPTAAVDPEEDDVAEIFYTSGTTGSPKGVMLTHRNLYLHALSSIIALGLRDDDVQLHAIPLFHVNGWGAPQSLTCVGGTHVLMRRFDPVQAMQLIQQERVTYTSLVPTMAHVLVNHPAVSAYDYSSLRMIVLGGAASSPELVRRVEECFGCRCYTGYGLSETSPILTIATPKSTVDYSDEQVRIQRQSMTGWPLVGVEMRLVDENRQPVAHNGTQAGEVMVRSDGMMKGYWQKESETRAAFGDGWLHTGDIGSIDEEGFLQLVDRKKDLIVSGGENIAPAEIESRLYAHDGVLECAVVAAPDAKWGEVPVAFIVPREGMKVTEEEILGFCREILAGYKCPKAVHFLSELPKGGTGKILKRELRRMAEIPGKT